MLHMALGDKLLTIDVNLMMVKHLHLVPAQASLYSLRTRCTPGVAQVAELVTRTKQQKAEVEAAISKMLSGRRVNILGEINNVLAAGA
jgi:hypothetical protein